MSSSRRFTVAVALALTVPATIGLPAAADPGRLGPIPCLDGSTVDFGQFCPVPTIRCADGTAVFLGQFCPVFKPQQAPPPQQPPPPAQQAPPPPAQAPPPPDPQKCRELGLC